MTMPDKLHKRNQKPALTIGSGFHRHAFSEPDDLSALASRLALFSFSDYRMDANNRPAFWHSKPFGIEPVVCSNWEEGWEKATPKASELSK